MKNILSIFSMIILLNIFSCTQKEEIITNNHTNVIIDDVIAPPYSEVTTVQIHNYINKLFIDLIGREPLEEELDDITSDLKQNQLSNESRDELIVDLMEQDAYHDRLLLEFSLRFLVGVGPEYIESEIYNFELTRENAIANGNQPYADYLTYELVKLNALLTMKEDFRSGTINISEYFQRIAFNDIYDEINMGNENFVLSCFENFLKRFPTDAELVAAVNMVDGFPNQLLLTDGINKLDFIKIVTNTPGFFEGLVFDIYKQLLVRDPNSQEMSSNTALFLNGTSFLEMQKIVLKTDEYAGF